MRCDRCEHWTVRRETSYDDGSIVINWQAPGDQGECDKLSQNTAPDFGCVKFLETDRDHVVRASKRGAPWQHSHAGPCPDCNSRGSTGTDRPGVCHRCAGTGKVRHYDDGWIGEEQTRLHPKEKELLKAGKPGCPACGREGEVEWLVCPYCGNRMHEPSAPTEVVDYQPGAIQGTTDEMIARMNAAKQARATEAAARVLPTTGEQR